MKGIDEQKETKKTKNEVNGPKFHAASLPSLSSVEKYKERRSPSDRRSLGEGGSPPKTGGFEDAPPCQALLVPLPPIGLVLSPRRDEPRKVSGLEKQKPMSQNQEEALQRKTQPQSTELMN